jgi:hypothetical protein
MRVATTFTLTWQSGPSGAPAPVFGPGCCGGGAAEARPWLVPEADIRRSPHTKLGDCYSGLGFRVARTYLTQIAFCAIDPRPPKSPFGRGRLRLASHAAPEAQLLLSSEPAASRRQLLGEPQALQTEIASCTTGNACSCTAYKPSPAVLAPLTRLNRPSIKTAKRGE